MIFSTTSEKFLSQSATAYYKFEKNKTPFVAVKIYIPGSMGRHTEVDEIVGKNFRSGKDVILKSKNHYAVLLQNTTLEAAQEATIRLGMKFYGMTTVIKKPGVNNESRASACLYGASEKTNTLRFKYIELIDNGHHGKTSETGSTNVGAYRIWLEPKKKTTEKTVSIVV
jgi:hypothetical protein